MLLTLNQINPLKIQINFMYNTYGIKVTWAMRFNLVDDIRVRYNGIIISFLPCCYFRGWENCYFLVILITFQSDSWTTKKSAKNYKVLLTIRLLGKYNSVLKITNSRENTDFRMNFKVFAKEILGRRQKTHTHTHTHSLHPCVKFWKRLK